MEDSVFSMPFGDAHDPIIIVDPDADDAWLLRRLLHNSGIHHPAMTFSTGRRAMEYLTYLASETPGLLPCLAFTTLEMSPLDGFELIRWLREHPRFNTLPVVAFAGWDVAGDTERALAAGAKLCVEKFPTEEALRTLLLEAVGA